jgi:hypothetical protein
VDVGTKNTAIMQKVPVTTKLFPAEPVETLETLAAENGITNWLSSCVKKS